MATTPLLTSCSSDDPFEDITPDVSNTWVEPYTKMGATMEDVKLYMKTNMKGHSLTNIQANMLVYSSGEGKCGIVYCFSPISGELYSVIDTEFISDKNIIHKRLTEHYSRIDNLEIGNVYYTNNNRSMAIVITDYDASYCNVTYTKVTQ